MNNIPIMNEKPVFGLRSNPDGMRKSPPEKIYGNPSFFYDRLKLRVLPHNLRSFPEVLDRFHIQALKSAPEKSQPHQSFFKKRKAFPPCSSS